MKYIFKSVLFFFSIIFVMTSYAQERKSSISGRILTKDGNPAVNVNITIKQSTHGTQTDDQGNFIIHHVPTGKQTVRISGLGIKPIEQIVAVKSGQNKLNTFTIFESTAQLAEVAVKGYKSAN